MNNDETFSIDSEQEVEIESSEDPAIEDPAIEDPAFDIVTIDSVSFRGTGYWDQGLYRLSNGKTVFASRDLDIGDIAINYSEIRTSGGGYYSAPSGVVGHYWPQNIDGGALIITQGDSFLQQLYVWGNHGPVMSSNLLDVTKQIGTIEQSADEDINGDGFIGAPEEDEIEVEVASVVYDNPNADFDRSIYKMTDGSVRLAEQGLSVGDLPYEGYDQLKAKDGSPINTVGVAGALWLDNGFGVIYNNDGVITQQSFKWGNSGLKPSGNLRDVSKQIVKVEENAGIDFNGDGFIGEQDKEDEISAVVFDDPNANFDRSIYIMTDGSVRLAEQGLSIGDLPFEAYDELKAKDGSPIETDGLVAAVLLSKGFGIIYNNDDIYNLQPFKWGNRGPKVSGKLRNITKKVLSIEDSEAIDINGDGLIGEQIEEAEISLVIFNDPGANFDRSIYQMTDGSVRLAEQGLSIGDLPFEAYDELKAKDGSPIETDGLVAAVLLSKGFGIIYNNDDIYKLQPFKRGNRGSKVSGKLRNITKQVLSIEDREGIDINGDGLIGEQFDDEAEVKLVLFSPDPDVNDRSIYELTTGAVVIGEIGVQPGEIPFEFDSLSNADGTFITADGVVGLIGTKKGEAVIFKKENGYFMQEYKSVGRGLKPKGKQRDITRRIYEIEDREDYDFTGDSIIGEPLSGNDLEIQKVVFPGSDEFDEGLYQMNNGDLVLAEPGLEPGDTPFEDEIIKNQSGKPYQSVNVVGIYPIKKGFALIEEDEGIYKELGFRFKGSGSPKPFGKKRLIKDIDKVEIKSDFDINNDGFIGSNNNQDQLDPLFRAIYQSNYDTLPDSLG